ncbi:MAG: YARHG domain-containing protein [Bacteroidales bacterium]|nr:YARHG domain-containing protein [Bacteroidales bacterium]
MKREVFLILSTLLIINTTLIGFGINKTSIIAKPPLSNFIPSDSVKIFSKYYTENDLENKTPEFLRFARNYFFAKHGYMFKDNCLNTFFNNQSWYKPIGSDVLLSDNEKMWVDRIKYLEKNLSKTPPLKVVCSFDFNQQPLFYLVSEFRYNQWEQKGEYRNGNFHLLKHTDIWILSCQEIPPELIQEMASETLRCSDDPYPLRKEDIQIVNFDKGCLNNQEQEILVRLYGPSNDDGHYVIGFDAEKNFSILIEDVFIQNKVNHSDSIIRFTSQERCDRIGTEFCIIEYDFNTISRKANRITKKEYQHIKTSKTRKDSVIVFKSERDAIKRNLNSIAYIIPPETEVRISHFLDKEKVFLIEFGHKIGWINQTDLHKLHVSFAD